MLFLTGGRCVVDRYARGYSAYNGGYSSEATPRSLRVRPRRLSGVGGMVNIIDNGNNMNGSLIASVVTIRTVEESFGATVLSTSMANPSVPGTFNVRRGTAASNSTLCPMRAGVNVRIVSIGLLLSSRARPII